MNNETKTGSGKNRSIIIFAAIAVVLIANLIVLFSGRTPKDDADEPRAETSVSGHVEDPDSISSDAAEEITWDGWQDAVLTVPELYADEAMTVPLAVQPQSGDRVIVCHRRGSACQVRYGTALGWTSADSLEFSGEPLIYNNEVSASSAAPVSAKDTETGKKLDAAAEKHGCAGVQIAVINNGRISHLYEYGYQDLANKVPLTENTKIRVASLSKTIVCMGVMSMHDMGIINIDEDISKYWGESIRNPRFPDTPITFRHLLTHTSSFDNFGYSKRDTSVLEENMRKAGSFMEFGPGELWAYKYNNSAICAAGAIAGRASGCNFDRYIREYFFAPLGIDASFHASNITGTEHISVVYNGRTPTLRVSDLQDIAYYGGAADDYSLYAGGMIISAKDMAKMICVLIGNGEYGQQYYLKPDSVKQMLQEYYSLKEYDQCLVLRQQDDLLDGRSLYYHNGNMAGVYSLACFDPVSGAGMVVITNGSKEPKMDNGVYSVCGDLAKIAAELWEAE